MQVAAGVEAILNNKSKLTLQRSHTLYAKPFILPFNKQTLADTRILAINEGKILLVLTN